MPRDQTRLTRTDARTFEALQDGPLTARQAGAFLGRAENTARCSLQRLVLQGLAVSTVGPHRGFGTGSVPWTWTLVPGAVFPGAAPRKTYTLHHVGEQVETLLPTQRPRRKGDLPTNVADKLGLAGLVSQITN